MISSDFQLRVTSIPLAGESKGDLPLKTSNSRMSLFLGNLILTIEGMVGGLFV